MSKIQSGQKFGGDIADILNAQFAAKTAKGMPLAGYQRSTWPSGVPFLKKNFEAEDGVKYRCLVFSLVEYRKNKEKEVITFYVTDDLNHLPVRLDLYLNFGSAKAFLSEIKGNRHPLTSIIKD